MINKIKYKKSRSITGQVLENLLNSQDFDSFVSSNSDGFNDESFPGYLSKLCETKQISKSDMVKNSGIERTYAYQILRGLRNPTRDKAIQLAIGLSLNYEEAQTLLRVARQSALYPRIKRDAAIIFCLNHHLTYAETQSMLDDIGEKTLS